MRHPAIWMLWLATAATLVMLARHPFYALLLLLAARLVAARCAAAPAVWQLPFWRLSAVVLGLGALYNGLFLHSGATVLGRLPAHWPLIGGPITAEALVFGLGNGLTLLALLAVFLAFNAAVSPTALLQLAPGALRDVGLVLLIALTYAPETARHWRRIEAAQALRGHAVRGWRDWQPLLMPLLIGGLERALNLAESMAARGYGGVPDGRAARRWQVALLIGLGLGLAGWLWALWGSRWGYALLAGGALTAVAALRHIGRLTPRTHFDAAPLAGRERLLAALLTAVVIVAWFARRQLIFAPFPALTLPPFDPLLGALLLVTAVPALWPAAAPPAP